MSVFRWVTEHEGFFSGLVAIAALLGIAGAAARLLWLRARGLRTNAGTAGRRWAVRGGGHSWCGSSVRQGGILLDLSRMKSIAIDAAGATATIGPGVQGLALIHRAAAHGLSFPVAHCPSVSLSGFLLNGGNGWNFNRWDSACSNVTAIDLVLADGREVTATSDEHPNLFWAARSAGPGFFGVATRYELKLHGLPRSITLSNYVFPGSATGLASELVDDLSSKLSRDVLLFMVIGAPPPNLAADNDTVVTVGAFSYTDSAADGEEALKLLNTDPRVRHALTSTVNASTDLDAFFGIVGGGLPGGHRYLVDNIWSDTPLKVMLAGSPEYYATAPSAKSHVAAVCFHPEFELKGTAHSMSGRYLVFNNTVWTDAADDAANRAWHPGATALLEPHKAGRYIGEADLDKEPNVARQCYAPEAWERLRALRTTYDPKGLFHDYLGTV
jgi:FAD/FMN-containing dehydrogenase